MKDHGYQLFNKNALSIIYLSKMFIQFDLGDKIPTFQQLSMMMQVSRGTIQKSIKILQDAEAIYIKPRGHMGTFLVGKDNKKLVQMANIKSFLGAMSLPYSKTYEGLATGLITLAQNEYDIPINMAYMRDAVKRIDEMIKGNYDFTIVCKNSALYAIKKGLPIEIVADFGQKTYLSEHVLLFNDYKVKKIEDGMKVGLAKNARDQNKWTKRMCKGKNVEFIMLDYSKVILNLKLKNIDVTVWNKDEINDSLIQMNTIPIESKEKDTAAVLVVDKNKLELIKLFKDIIDIDKVKKIQQDVIDEKIPPQY